MKICSHCDTEKPNDADHFVISRKKRKDGTIYICLLSKCKTCAAKKALERYHARGFAGKQRQAEMAKIRRATLGREDRATEYLNRKIKRAGSPAAYAAKQDALRRLPFIKRLVAVLRKVKNQKKPDIPLAGLQHGVCWLWNNPALTEGQKYATRYRLDADFNIKERMRRHFNKRRKRDAIGTIMREALKRAGRSNAVERSLGYTVAELRAHLERQFIKGMSWDVFLSGAIHIDHIVPQAAFDLSDDQEWRSCWSLANLRPCWAAENLAKSSERVFLL